MHYFGFDGNNGYGGSSDRGRLVLNHEAITPLFLHPTGPTATGTGVNAARTVTDEVQREFFVQGVSVVEVKRSPAGSAWPPTPPARPRWIARVDRGRSRR